MSNLQVNMNIPDAFQELFSPYRYKIYYGGRGSAKSWSFAQALALQGVQRPLRVLCARELQNSMKDSVWKLIGDKIKEMGLSDHYEILQDSIKGPNGTEFSFAGIRQNVDKIKSYEGVDVCWVEEAHKVTKNSWDVLIPTIRKDGSEIWISFNPELDTDETYKRFILNKPTNSIVKKVSWRDNPWFTAPLMQELLDLKERDYDAYLHVYEGNCKVLIEGAVYEKEIRQAITEGRICSVPYDPLHAVHTAWDLGWADSTVIWFYQKIGFQIRVIDYLEDRQRTVEHYLLKLQEKGYVYGTDHLPHDAENKGGAGGSKTIAGICRAKGRNVRIVPRQNLVSGLNLARTIFPACVFDEAACGEGLKALKAYRYEVAEDEHKALSRVPVHDWASHGADGFRYMAWGCTNREGPKDPLKLTGREHRKLDFSRMADAAANWMGR